MAAPASVLVEIDAQAERVVDARSTRRLVPLELSDVAVPAKGSPRSTTVLFFRVLGRADRSLRIELWERGEFHGARLVAGSSEHPQLVARRVALAAAELVRRLARRREAALARAVRERIARESRLASWRQLTQDGPRALRAELTTGGVPGSLWTIGSRMSAELSLLRALRLDVGGELSSGWLQPRLNAALYGMSVGPAYRVALLRGLDVDLGLDASALLLLVPGANRLDEIAYQDASWTARLRSSWRLELALSRQVRGVLGGEFGAILRGVNYRVTDPHRHRLEGVWVGAALGLVVTPAR